MPHKKTMQKRKWDIWTNCSTEIGILLLKGERDKAGYFYKIIFFKKGVAFLSENMVYCKCKYFVKKQYLPLNICKFLGGVFMQPAGYAIIVIFAALIVAVVVSSKNRNKKDSGK